MGRLVAIGGGKIETQETLPIDREIVRLTGKRKPNVLFIPTASGDASEYCDNFQAVYRGWLWKHFDHCHRVEISNDGEVIDDPPGERRRREQREAE